MSRGGIVFDVSHGCVDDGPGLRTVVFLKGCSMGCPWCHNPEGMARAPQVGLDPARCIDCGSCAEACPRTWRLDQPDAWRSGCTACGKCVHACPSGARRLVGREVTAAELVHEILADQDYFDGTGGGVTFSGGEPMLQADFLFDCARRLRAQRVHVAVETAGLWPARLAPDLAAIADLVLFDLKHCDRAKLTTVLGHDGGAAIDNVETLLTLGVEVELRLTLIPGVNADDRDLQQIAAWLANHSRVPPVRLQRFHRMAAAKDTLYAAEYAFAEAPPLAADAVDRALAVLAAHSVPIAAD